MFTIPQLEAISAVAERKLAFAGSMIPKARNDLDRLYYRQCAERVSHFWRHVIIDCDTLLDPGLHPEDDAELLADAAASLEQAIGDDCDLNHAIEMAAPSKLSAAA